MNDKLIELHNLSGKSHVSLNTSTSSQDGNLMPEFHNKVKLIQNNLDRLVENNLKLEETLDKLLNKVPNAQENLSAQLQEIIMWNQKQHFEIKEIINKVAVEVSQQNQSYEPETQWKVNQLNALKIKAQDLAKSNLFLYIRYKKGLLDQLMICPQQVQEIEKKQQFIESYIDQLTLLLEIQGNMIDNIEINLMNAQDYIQAIERPFNHVRQFRSKWKKINLVILVVIGIFVMIILLSFIN